MIAKFFSVNAFDAKAYLLLCGWTAELRCFYHRTQVLRLATPDEDVIEAVEEIRMDPLIREGMVTGDKGASGYASPQRS